MDFAGGQGSDRGGASTSATGRLGSFELELGSEHGAALSPLEGEVREPDPELRRALDDVERQQVEEERKATVGTAATEAVDRAEAVTDKVERATELFDQVARGQLDPADLRAEIDTLLDRLAELDRTGHLAEALRLARAVEKLLALVERWRALADTLTKAGRAARALGDERALAWTKHELGTLQLASGDARSAERNLGRARELRGRLGDRAGLRVTEQNMQALCHELRRLVREEQLVERGRGGWRRLPATVLAAAALALLLAGGVTGAVIGGDGDEPEGEGEASQPSAGDGGGGGSGPEGRHTLTLEPPSRGGSLRSRPRGVACPPGPCTREFPAGASVTLVATADEGFDFKGWEGDCAGTSGPSCTLSMDADRSASAFFTRTEPETATLTVSATNVTVTSDPAGISCPDACTLTLPVESPVTLTVAPAGNLPPGAYNWGGACTGTPETSATCQLILSGPTSVEVNYPVPG